MRLSLSDNAHAPSRRRLPPPEVEEEDDLLLLLMSDVHHLVSEAFLAGDSREMQGVLGRPPDHLDHSTPPNQVDEMEVTTGPQTKEINQSDSGIFSATSNTTFAEVEAEDNRSECSSPETRRKFVCPICETMLSTQHAFTLHIRSHNNNVAGGGGGGVGVLGGGSQPDEVGKGYTCRICAKVLSSSSSLDRHVLVHSGERPFTCKHCGDTFTTNGNMHRHMRTHKTDNYESDASVESTASSAGSKGIEYNNNKVDSKRKLAEDEDDDELDLDMAQVRKKAHLDGGQMTNGISRKCPVCARDDFVSGNALEVHLEDNHPDYPAKCHKCNQIFNNQKRLNYHKMTVHADDANGRSRSAVVHGFKHIDFVDFSSAKFPVIARHECEKTFHKATAGPRFVCAKCSRAFPCDQSLESHATECGLALGVLRTTASSDAANIMRDEFFHRLDLEDTSFIEQQQQNALRALPLMLGKSMPRLEEAIKSLDAGKDLADIPSIISMTKGCFLQQLHAGGAKQADVSSGSLDAERTEEEESQDLFAVEFRKMKLRGEFPCRLCASVFPNLRALKGHNRTHLNAAHNGTYRCNMCPHSSIDKAALIRHMRTHNGDRPYECSLCNYAFTTKANCERHLRNRHAKSTREEVKKSIIYHPSEDPTNEDINKQIEAKKQLNTSSNSIDSTDLSAPPARSSTPKNAAAVVAFPDVPQLSKEFFSVTPKESPDSQHFATSTPHKSVPNIRVKDVNVLKQQQQVVNTSTADDDEDDDDEDDSEPMDLSKKKSELNASVDEESAATMCKAVDPPPTPQFPMSELLSQHLLKVPPSDPSFSLYAHLATLCRTGFPNYFPGFPINPLMMPPVLPESPLLTQEMRDRLQRQLSGGGIKNVYPPTNYPYFGDLKLEPSNLPKSGEDLEPLSVHVDSYNDQQQQQQQMKSSPAVTPKSELLQSPNSVKMIIKNGVLMPKQKQRRYRTERPFSCEHCAARFTLRSNMERHIKQQHPQYWSQRQRSGLGTPGRKPLMPPTINASLCELSIPSYEAKSQVADHLSDERGAVSEKLKYAILSQHLRAAQEVKKEEVEEDALIIDEMQPEEAPKKEVKVGILEEKLKELREKQSEQVRKQEDSAQDLVSVSRLLVNASQQQHQLKEYFRPDHEDNELNSEEDEEGLVASGSTSEGNSGTDENRSESDNIANPPEKKKSAYSLAPNRVSCPYCSRKFPWTSSLRRHILTHTGQKPFKCSHCPLLFTTKSNCDRHLLRKHGNSATTISNEASASSFMMRNVPERPFKCSTCPSSTFSTYSNLKKHMIAKHGAQDDRQGYEAGSSEDEKNNSDHRSEWEAQISQHSKTTTTTTSSSSTTTLTTIQTPSAPIPEITQSSNSDLPFKCHLCDSSFCERQECLEHIHDKHASEYELLMSKNALDPNASTPDESNQHEDEDNEEKARGKFPDYSNRKVICAFCMRRFWSAEDLRRHMRTHTGERPFSCDICRRRFTLKHSMLRHRKKHNQSFDADANQSDDESGALQLPPAIIKQEKRDEPEERDIDSDVNEGGSDLISNLLGIRDRSLIDQVLTGSADDAAKLLGVGN